jgi:hypothetical protein
MEKVAQWVLYNLYSSPDFIRQIKSRRKRWAGHVAPIGEGRNMYRALVGKPEGNRPRERPRCTWHQNGPYGDWLGGCGVDLPGSGQGPLAGRCVHRKKT